MTTGSDTKELMDMFVATAIERMKDGCWSITKTACYMWLCYALLMLFFELPNVLETWLLLGAVLCGITCLCWAQFLILRLRGQSGTFGRTKFESRLLLRAIARWQEANGIAQRIAQEKTDYEEQLKQAVIKSRKDAPSSS